MQADQSAVDEMQDLFNGLQFLSEQLKNNRVDEAKNILDQIGTRFGRMLKLCEESLMKR